MCLVTSIRYKIILFASVQKISIYTQNIYNRIILNIPVLSVSYLSFLMLMDFWRVIYRRLFVLFVEILNDSYKLQIAKRL